MIITACTSGRYSIKIAFSFSIFIYIQPSFFGGVFHDLHSLLTFGGRVAPPLQGVGVHALLPQQPVVKVEMFGLSLSLHPLPPNPHFVHISITFEVSGVTYMGRRGAPPLLGRGSQGKTPPAKLVRARGCAAGPVIRQKRCA